MNRFLIPALLATAVFSANASAHDDGDEDRWERHGHHRMEHVVVQRVYEEPEVIYREPPVIYRERIVYRDRPVYYETEPRHYEAPASYYPESGSNRLIGQAIGAIAGGALGNQVGRGNGRIAATAIGAVVGSAIGGDLAVPGY